MTDLGSGLELPHLAEVRRASADVSRELGKLVGLAVQSKLLGEAHKAAVARTVAMLMTCTDCGEGNSDPARLLLRYGVSEILACPSCVARHARAALGQGFTPPQLEELLRVVAALRAATTFGHETGGR